MCSSDLFRCQYCGRPAPEIVLQVDHINPVKHGGKNDLLNLVTSCLACNNGKGAIPLGDFSVLSKQREALELLEERGAQLAMLMAWREGLDALDDETLDAVVKDVESRFKCKLDGTGVNILNKSVKKFGARDTLEAIRICERQYLVMGSSGFTEESITHAINYIPKVANGIRLEREDPGISKILYARGILRKRLSYVPHDSFDRLNRYVSSGIDVEFLVQCCKTARSWGGLTLSLDSILSQE